MSAIAVEPGVRRIAPTRRVVRDGAVALTRQLGLVLLAALVYFGVRGMTEGDVGTAVAHARDVVGLERRLGIDVERSLQASVLGHHWIVTLANWVYIWGHWPVIGGTLVWLHRRDVDTYRMLRNAMFVSGAIGLVVFALYPVAPPRLAGLGFVDTVTAHSSSYRVLQPPALVNKYAAVPSLHVGWNLLVGLFVWRGARRAWVRWVGVVSPLLMLAAVVLTANHYVVDGIVGIAIATLGLLVVRQVCAGRADAATARAAVPARAVEGRSEPCGGPADRGRGGERSGARRQAGVGARSAHAP